MGIWGKEIKSILLFVLMISVIGGFTGLFWPLMFLLLIALLQDKSYKSVALKPGLVEGAAKNILPLLVYGKIFITMSTALKRMKDVAKRS